MSFKQNILYHPLTGRLYLAWRYGWETASVHPYLSIEGWLSVPEALELFRIARHEIPSEEVVVVEIGSFLGKSSVVLGKALKPKRNARLYCVDPFDASGDSHSEHLYREIAQEKKKSLFERFEENVRRCGVRDQLEPVRSFSHDAVRQWTRKIDFLFIDGNHAFDAVKHDFETWGAFVKPGGYIAFHDVLFDDSGNPQPPNDGPGRLIQDILSKIPTWKKVSHVESVFVIQKSV